MGKKWKETKKHQGSEIRIMADRNHQSQQKPINRRYFSSNSAESPFTNPKPSNLNSYSSTSSSTKKASYHTWRSDGINKNKSSRASSTMKTTTSNWESDDTNKFVNYDLRQDFPSLIGTCPYMCPVEERARRERLRDLAVFERLHGDPAKSSSNLAVKKFCRTISGKDVRASDVRPVSVLEDTLNYLLSLLDNSQCPFHVVHDFIFDRTRSIRQDLSMQNAMGDQVIHMYEKMVKFHILSGHHLRSSGTADSASMCHLNNEQLTKALMNLFSLYNVDRESNCSYQNEAEYYSFYLLFHLASDTQGESLSLWLRRIPSQILKSKEICFARKILRYFRVGNYKRFIYTTEEEASFLQYCIIEPFINEIRLLAVSSITYGGYKLQPYPVMQLSKLLLMKESDVESLCLDRGLEMCIDGTGKGLLPNKQQVTCKPKGSIPKYYPLYSERIESLFAEPPEL